MTAQVGDLPVVVRAGAQTVRTTSSAGGYIDVMVPDHGLGPGWHEVVIEAKAAEPTTATVLVVDPAARIGVVSDIDDTVMITMLPRAFIAAWNTFVRHTSARRPVPGMAELYRRIVAEHPHAPVFYLSTGAWNVVPTLRTFLGQHGLPHGPMLMTDWGPTNTGWFRSGIEHKRTRLRDLMITFPEIRWVLVGDDGQHDPMIYDDVARMHPRKVAAIAIRTLSPTEQVLSHGTPETLGRPSAQRNVTAEHGVPSVLGRDGYALAGELPALLPAD
jgi:phosphatidate phosphatase APP1